MLFDYLFVWMSSTLSLFLTQTALPRLLLAPSLGQHMRCTRDVRLLLTLLVQIPAKGLKKSKKVDVTRTNQPTNHKTKQTNKRKNLET